jgi:hypothetical protein
VTTDKNPVPAPDPAPSGAHEALARLRGIVQTVHDDTFSNRCHEEQDVCSLTRHVCADVLAEIDKLLAAEKLTAAAGGEEVIEMRRCEIPYLVLRAGPLYRFSDAPGCEKCAAYADLKQPLCGAHPAIAPYFVRRADVLLRLKAEAERDALKQAAERAGREAALKGLRAVEDDLQKQRPWTQVMQNLKGYIAALQAPQGPGAANRLPVVDDEDGAGGAEQGDERDEKPEPEFDMDAPMVADEAYVRDLHKTTSRRGNGGGYMLHPDEIVCSRDELAKLCESWLSLAKKPEPASAPSAEAVDAMIRSRDAEIARLRDDLAAAWASRDLWMQKALRASAAAAGAVSMRTLMPGWLQELADRGCDPSGDMVYTVNRFGEGAAGNPRFSLGFTDLRDALRDMLTPAPATSAPSAPEPAGDAVLREFIAWANDGTQDGHLDSGLLALVELARRALPEAGRGGR